MMNLKSFYKCVDKYVEGAFPKRGTTALEALAELKKLGVGTTSTLERFLEDAIRS